MPFSLFFYLQNDFYFFFFLSDIFQFANCSDMTNTKLLLLFGIIKQFVLQNAQLTLVANVVNVNYPCNHRGCSPATIISVSTLENCKMACLNNAGCRTVTFDPNSKQCGLFFDSPGQNCKSLPQAGVTTMTTSTDEQLSTHK
jgi:hypothetical protein